MNIGDRVRSIGGNEEGIVTGFISEREVEVEIEDGFRIPFLRAELVLVSKDETKAFGDNPTPLEDSSKKNKPQIPVYAEKGIFLAFTHLNDKLLELHLINNTDLTIPVLLGSEKKGMYEGIYVGGLNPKTHKKVHQLNLDDFEQWPLLIVQGLLFKAGLSIAREPLVRKLKFKAQAFMKSKKEVPMLGMDGYVFQLDVEELGELDADQLKNGILESDQPAQEQIEMPKAPKTEIDLHAEALGIEGADEKNILSLQILHFEKELEAAIAHDKPAITFIHGVGAGILKQEIEKRLKKYKEHIEFFQEAQKEKFGYGAIKIKLK
ncbi:Smr/MutS family protein [Algivirga pacifica]|uniref:DUF2027 domain-containing protein n=1 Tax=Algivirga pacifica TaxID=1162670 RepID=A0ABP9DAB1_9BACT